MSSTSALRRIEDGESAPPLHGRLQGRGRDGFPKPELLRSSVLSLPKSPWKYISKLIIARAPDVLAQAIEDPGEGFFGGAVCQGGRHAGVGPQAADGQGAAGRCGQGPRAAQTGEVTGAGHVAPLRPPDRRAANLAIALHPAAEADAKMPFPEGKREVE